MLSCRIPHRAHRLPFAKYRAKASKFFSFFPWTGLSLVNKMRYVVFGVAGRSASSFGKVSKRISNRSSVMEDEKSKSQVAGSCPQNPKEKPDLPPWETGLSKEERIRLEVASAESAAAVHLREIIGQDAISIAGILTLVQKFKNKARDSHAPVKDLLEEGCLVSHYRMLAEHGLAHKSGTPEAAAIHTSMAVKLQDSNARTARAIQDLGATPKQSAPQGAEAQAGAPKTPVKTSVKGDRVQHPGHAREGTAIVNEQGREVPIANENSSDKESKAGGGGPAQRSASPAKLC
jgi:hypothetical protein